MPCLRLMIHLDKRGYRETDWPASKRKSGGEKISKRRKPAPTPIEEWIRQEQEKERKGRLERPFDDDLPF